MKIKVLSRREEDFTRDRKADRIKVFRNANPQLHKFERAREYVRALNAAKWEKIFSQPFVGALDGHTDGVYCMANIPTSLTLMASAGGEGEIRMWHLARRKCIWKASMAHAIGNQGTVIRGLSVDGTGQRLFSCSIDKTVKIWAVHRELDLATAGASQQGDAVEPLATYVGGYAFVSVDCQRKSSMFATAGENVDLWDQDRSEPIHSFNWGADTVHFVRFNPVDTNLLCSTAMDRAIVLYDVRQKTPIRKLVMQMSTNQMAWNPMEAFNFTTACEDSNCYSFDMRKLESATTVHKDHVAAVMSIDYAPTGRGFVTGSYDKTVRIFDIGAGHSREVYHTKRMQRIFSVKWSADNRYVLSGSDDTNIRLWKAKADDRVKPLLPREMAKKDYLEKLKDRFKYHKETGRILRHRHLPKAILNARKLRATMLQSRKEKMKRLLAHSKPGQVWIKNERKKKIVREEE